MPARLVSALRRSVAEHARLLKDLTDQGYGLPGPATPCTRTDRHPPELLGDARPREGYDREKSVSSGL
ncbi:MAG: hypothetical protein ACLUVY_06390 [Bacteroides uniformis]